MKLDDVKQKLLDGEVVALQTDTVFGLFVTVQKNNFKKINTLKNRDINQKAQIFFNNFSQIKAWTDLQEWQLNFLKQNLPSNNSYIVKTNQIGFNKTGLKTVQIRFPKKKESPLTFDLINDVGPLFASSANLHGEDILDNCKEIVNKFNVSCSSFSKRKNKKPSKIYSLLDNEVKRFR